MRDGQHCTQPKHGGAGSVGAKLFVTNIWIYIKYTPVRIIFFSSATRTQNFRDRNEEGNRCIATSGIL